MSSIAVIIPTMNRPQTLQRTLNSITGSSRLPDSIVVVDQSIDRDIATRNRQLLESTPVESAYIYQHEPSSTKARNTGMSSTNADIIVFCDDDIDIDSDTFANIETIMNNKDIALIAGIDKNGGTSKTNIGYFLGTKSFRKRHIGHVTASLLGRYPDEIKSETETEWAMGYFFAIRKALLDEWSIRWDENLIKYAYNEDLDFSYRYCQRAKAAGMKCILTPDVKVSHLVSKEYRVPSKTSTYMYVLHRLYMAHKYSMSISGIVWCDFWRFLERLIHKESPMDMVNVYRVAIRHSREIQQGRISKYLEC